MESDDFRIINIYNLLIDSNINNFIRCYEEELSYSIIAGEHFLNYEIKGKKNTSYWSLLNNYIKPKFSENLYKEIYKNLEQVIQANTSESLEKKFAAVIKNLLIVSDNEYFYGLDNLSKNEIINDLKNYIEKKENIEILNIYGFITSYSSFKDYLSLLEIFFLNTTAKIKGFDQDIKFQKQFNQVTHFCKSVNFKNLPTDNNKFQHFDIFKLIIYISEIDFNFHSSNEFKEELFKLNKMFFDHYNSANNHQFLKIIEDKLIFLLYKCLFREVYSFDKERNRVKNSETDFLYFYDETNRFDVIENVFNKAEDNNFIFKDFVSHIKDIYLKENLVTEKIKYYFDCHKKLKNIRSFNNYHNIKLKSLNEVKGYIRNNKKNNLFSKNYDIVALDSLNEFYKRTEFKLALSGIANGDYRKTDDINELKNEIKNVDRKFKSLIQNIISDTEIHEPVDYEPIIVYVKFINSIAKSIREGNFDGNSKQEIIQLLSDNFNKAVVHFEILFKNCKDKFYLPLYLPFEECLTNYTDPSSSISYKIHIDSSYTLPVDFDIHYNEFDKQQKEWFRTSNSIIIDSYHSEIEYKLNEQTKEINKEINTVQAQSIQLMSVFATVIALIMSFVSIAKETKWKLHEILSLSIILMLFILVISAITIHNFDTKNRRIERWLYIIAFIMLLVLLKVYFPGISLFDVSK